MSARSYKNEAQGLVEYALILVLIAVVVIGILAFFGSSTSGGIPIPFLSKRPPYPPRADYGRVEDIVIQDIAVSSVKSNQGSVFGQDTQVAVYTFDAPQGTQGGALVSDIFAATLREKGYQVFERSEIERVLREQQLLIEGRTTASDLDIAQRLGQLGTVQYMVFGAVTLYNSEGQTILLPVTVAQEDREVYEEEYEEYRDWYINGLRLALNRWTTDAFDRAEMLRVEEEVLSIEELEKELLKDPREEFRTIASVGISAKIVDVQTGEIVWMGQSETTDFTLVQASSRVVEELLNSALSPLESNEPPEQTALRESAEAAVVRALAEGGPEEREALAAKLRVTADSYAAGQRAGSPALALAEHLRALAERLEGGEGS